VGKGMHQHGQGLQPNFTQLCQVFTCSFMCSIFSM
jgi:hypothetical protein